VTVGAALLAYAAVVGTLGARVLRRVRWLARAPLLGVLLYQAATWSVVAAVGLAGLTLAVHATALGGGLSHLIGACVQRLRLTYATPGGATVAGLGLTLTGAVVVRTMFSAVTSVRASGRQARQHADTARIVGVRDPGLGAIVVDHPRPAAYCVTGRRPTVVLTTGTLGVLDCDQLGAVLAHERAHLAWHHHQLLAAVRIGRQVLPFLPLMREADTQVTRLIEAHADDVAAPARGSGPLASALVLLATAATPATVLAAAATDVVQRVHRLLGPAGQQQLSLGRRRLLGATAAALTVTPVLLALAPAVLALALGRVPGA